MFDISFPIAFVGGIISFFAPCAVPLIPAYIGYVLGVSTAELKTQNFTAYGKKLLMSSIFYILGFSIVFTTLGAASGGIGQILRAYDFWVQRVGGLLIVILGLNFTGFLPIPLFAKERKISLLTWIEQAGYLRAAGLGFVFALAWTPCVGVILGSILALVVVTATATKGALLLFVYSLGISVPFIIVSLTLAQAPRYFKVIVQHSGLVAKIAGLILVGIGLLLLTDTYKFVNAWMFDIAFKLGYRVR